MPSRKPLSDQQIREKLTSLPGWEIRDGKLYKTFKFKDFVQALGWMVKVGVEAEKMDHHPNWSNSWNKVEVTLWTHSEDAVTEMDIELAERMEKHAV